MFDSPHLDSRLQLHFCGIAMSLCSLIPRLIPGLIPRLVPRLIPQACSQVRSQANSKKFSSYPSAQSLL